jgi:hypothetical protein
MRHLRLLTLAALSLVGLSGPLEAQAYRVRLDVRGQSVGYRGIARDSIAATAVVTGSSGGLETPDGFAAACSPGSEYCSFYRPGPKVDAGALTTTADVTVWGLGVEGLSLHATARLGVGLGGSNAWPGTDPALQLFEGYAQYVRRAVTARLGRQFVTSRLGYSGFDGGRVSWKSHDLGLDAAAYGGWSLARAASVPITSPSLNPLSEYQPRQRFVLAGAAAGWRWYPIDLRIRYEREIDPSVDRLVGERVGGDAVINGPYGLSLVAGGDFDLVSGLWGNAEGTLGYAAGRLAVRVGARQYRPYFPLWTIWGAFSPVPYSATFGSVSLGPFDGLSLRASGEQYWYDDAEADVPLANVETSGWRWNGDGSLTYGSWLFRLGYQRDEGPGGKSNGWEGSVGFAPTPALTVTARGGNLFRALEFRYSDSDLWFVGLEGVYRLSDILRANVGIVRYDEWRARPDAGAFAWDQLRLVAGLSFVFGTPADRGVVPEVIRRMPEASVR